MKKVYIKNGLPRNIEQFENECKDGKIIYEVIRITKGKPLFYEAHYDRFINSLKLSGSNFTMTKEWFRKNIEMLVKENKLLSENIKITYNLSTGDLLLFLIEHKYPTLKMYSEGVECILYFGERNNPNAKVIDNNFRPKGNAEIERRGAFEAILVNRYGVITEGSKSNIFLIKDNKLYTSKVENVLPGVTRTEIIKMAKENNIEVIEENINYTTLPSYDAMFISGTSPHILPINSVEGHKFNCKNELLKKLINLFKEKRNEYFLNFK